MTRESVPIAYIMSRFPKLTETFVLYEMLELRKLGFEIVVFPLLRETETTAHPEIESVGERVVDAPLLAPRTLFVNAKWLICHPVRYVTTWLRAALGTLGNLKFLAAACLYYPKAVVFADAVAHLGIAHIHAHFASHPALTAWMMHQLCGVSYSFTAHGTDLHVAQQMLRKKAQDAAFAVTISDYNRRFIAERCGARTADLFEIIRCGTDLSLFTPSDRAPNKTAPFEILCVASFRLVKGHRILIDACAELRRRKILFRCRLIGYGPRENEIRRQIEALGLSEWIINEGARSRPEVIAALGKADVLVLASIQTQSGSREGIPVSLMEGMACGLPIVASRISGIPELVEEGQSGFLFAPGNSLEAADALERLARDPALRSRMGQSARARVAQSYDLSQNARLLADRIQSEIWTQKFFEYS